MKKLFHRKKSGSTPSSPEQTPPRARKSDTVNNAQSLRTSLYESTAPASEPKTGQYPLKGNGSAVALPGRRSDTYSRSRVSGEGDPSPRLSTSSPYYGSLPAPRVTSASHDRSYDNRHAKDYRSEQDLRKDKSPIDDFSRLNLGAHERKSYDEGFPLQKNHGNYAFTNVSQDPNHSGLKDEGGLSHDERTPGVRMVGQGEPSRLDRDTRRQTGKTDRGEESRYNHHDQDYGRYRTDSANPANGNPQMDGASLSRKTPTQPSGYGGYAAANHPASSPASRLDSRLDTNRHQTSYDSTANSRQRDHYGSKHITTNAQPHPLSHLQHNGRGFQPSAQQVAARARQDTYDTEVVEKVAPAVIHETIHKDIHHVREEHITQEIHTHDVYHRILPVVDVEVLPPRHFLPVEGGGLVEISGKEVPGRGRNWVIAETASKIPSDQPGSTKPREFSARQFPGTEGDAIKYITPEGHEKTEQTWVHPPELETGGRDSGQTWPMEFGTDASSKPSREQRSSKTHKSKHHRKPVESQPSISKQPGIRTG
ncbi:MAG: hypothetical protein Q9183_000460 [Haloplaca sp. 2 TL-2023]